MPDLVLISSAYPRPGKQAALSLASVYLALREAAAFVDDISLFAISAIQDDSVRNLYPKAISKSLLVLAEDLVPAHHYSNEIYYCFISPLVSPNCQQRIEFGGAVELRREGR